MDYTVHGILQARILEWVAFPFSSGSSQPGDLTQVFHIAGRFFTSWATREAPKPHLRVSPQSLSSYKVFSESAQNQNCIMALCTDSCYLISSVIIRVSYLPGSFSNNYGQFPTCTTNCANKGFQSQLLLHSLQRIDNDSNYLLSFWRIKETLRIKCPVQCVEHSTFSVCPFCHFLPWI